MWTSEGLISNYVVIKYGFDSSVFIMKTIGGGGGWWLLLLLH
jgi:hypothetical protein